LAIEITRFLAEEHACDYLPSERAQLEYRVLAGLQPGELDDLLARGWRRFGAVVFRPACRACGECVSLRIPVDDFQLSRSQRRARNRCAHLTVEAGLPAIDDERLDLYTRWHAAREEARGWPEAPLDVEEYARQFGAADVCGREVTYRDAGKLVGVGICDETAAAWSAVYFFHDPAYARLSPGVNHVLTLIDRARREGKRFVYLGFRVMGCFSMRYKAGFLPHELLEGRPAAGAPPRWRRVEERAADALVVLRSPTEK
jgi:arginyl-tRNA--protein-N-Asp/Glu arginylyltransferase